MNSNKYDDDFSPKIHNGLRNVDVKSFYFWPRIMSRYLAASSFEIVAKMWGTVLKSFVPEILQKSELHSNLVASTSSKKQGLFG
jgi:hypothetical protein